MDVLVVVLAGGIGKRLWPLSTIERPKYLLDVNGQSLIRSSFDRGLLLTDASGIFVATAEANCGLVLDELPKLRRENVILEPAVRNTAAAICLSNEILADRFGDRPIVFMPSDSVIGDLDSFKESMISAIEFSWATGTMVTVGVSPQNPSSQYGYVKIRGAASSGKKIFAVDKFVEKPDTLTAEKYLRSGRYLWNTGMVISTTGAIVRAFRFLAPDIYGNVFDYIHGDRESYGLVRKTSFDYAVLEKLSNLFAIAGNFAWDDVGSFESLSKYRACSLQ